MNQNQKQNINTNNNFNKLNQYNNIQQNNVPSALGFNQKNPLFLNNLNHMNNLSYVSHNQKNIYDNSKNITANLEEYEDDEDSTKSDGFVYECITNRKFSELSDKDLLGNIIMIAKEQAGCRFLQQKIDDNPNFANYELYPEIHDVSHDLICDPFGNYLIQRMLESLTTDKINHFMKQVNLFFF